MVEAIANLKKRFVIQVVVVWKSYAECPGDGCTWSKYAGQETYLLTLYSRLSLFRLSEMRPPRYIGHLVWHGMLAICFLQKLDLKYGHSLFRLPASADCPK